VQRKPEEIEVYYENRQRKIRCFCGKICSLTIVPHMRLVHPKEWREWVQNFIELRNNGLSTRAIIRKFTTRDGRLLFTNSVVEREIRRAVEKDNTELRVQPKGNIDQWEPSLFKLERTTLWNFRQRGSWAVHQGDYRGNWPPMVPRNLILRYSTMGDLVLDPFVGGGTTLIEAWLNNRRSFGLDVSPLAVGIAQQRIKEMEDKAKENKKPLLERELKPILQKADARNVKRVLARHQITDRAIKLACLHPPYLNSLRYTETIDSDLSRIHDENIFCDELQNIASQIYDLVADDGTCAVLIGDVKRNKKVIPLGFLVMQRFKQEDFQLKDIIIKAQHKDSSTRFWYTKREKVDYLMAHEYLFIFGK
jgi:hypothetical protein